MLLLRNRCFSTLCGRRRPDLERGGFGWLSRKYGMKVENLISSADVITAEGELLGASEQENEDLFWGIRGGGGNLGS